MPTQTGAYPVGCSGEAGTFFTLGAVWMAAWPRMSKRVVRPLSKRAIWFASRMPKSVPSRVTVSFTRSSRACASVTGVRRTWWAIYI